MVCQSGKIFFFSLSNQFGGTVQNNSQIAGEMCKEKNPLRSNESIAEGAFYINNIVYL